MPPWRHGRLTRQCCGRYHSNFEARVAEVERARIRWESTAHDEMGTKMADALKQQRAETGKLQQTLLAEVRRRTHGQG